MKKIFVKTYANGEVIDEIEFTDPVEACIYYVKMENHIGAMSPRLFLGKKKILFCDTEKFLREYLDIKHITALRSKYTMTRRLESMYIHDDTQ